MFGYPSCDLGPRAHLQLAPDVLDVRFRGPRRDGQAHRDAMVGQPGRDQPGHLQFTAGEARPGPEPAGSDRKPSIAARTSVQ